MNEFDKQWELESDLGRLREQLLIADAKYENAICIAERHTADIECKRLRDEIRATQLQLRSLREALENPSDPGAVSEAPKKKSQSVGD